MQWLNRTSAYFMAMRREMGSKAAAAVVWATVLVGSVTSAATAETRAVVTIKPIHGLVTRIMEGAGTPKLLITGASSPHTFSMKPSDARALNGADVFFRVSEQIEPFTGKVVKALPKSVRVVTLADVPGVTALDLRSGDTFETHAHDEDRDHGHESHGHGKAGSKHDKSADHDDEGNHDHERAGKVRDGHVWLDPKNAKAMVDAIVAALVEVAPGDAAKLKANAAALQSDLDALEAEIARDLEAVKGRPFVVFHDAYQYFERRFGLNAVGSITVSPEVQPSAKRLTEIRRKIGNLDARCVFAEPQFSPRLVAAVTEGTKAISGTLDPEGATIKEGPSAYFDLLRGLASGLKGCLAQAS
ncbi:MAG: zinc ABC transporter substrate-binding protein [Hyphomicrobium sp.]